MSPQRLFAATLLTTLPVVLHSFPLTSVYLKTEVLHALCGLQTVSYDSYITRAHWQVLDSAESTGVRCKLEARDGQHSLAHVKQNV